MACSFDKLMTAKSNPAWRSPRPRRTVWALAISRTSVLLPSAERRRRPGRGYFRGSMAGLCDPLSMLRRCPRGHLRMTWDQCDSLLLHRDGLAPSTPCRSPGALRFFPNKSLKPDLAPCQATAGRKVLLLTIECVLKEDADPSIDWPGDWPSREHGPRNPEIVGGSGVINFRNRFCFSQV